MTDEDHNLLIRIDERTSRMETWMFNHDAHHLKYSIMAWGMALTAIIALVVTICTR